MGTRHLIAVQKDGEYKIAQYGQWDGYPSGQGRTVLDFLQNVDMPRFRERLDNVVFLDDEQIAERWYECGAPRGSAFVGMDVSNKFFKKYPELSRDTGATILQLVLDAPGQIGLRNAITFAGDGLFCEYAYVIDLDAGSLEVYQGFHKGPIDASERFATFERVQADYAPVKHVKTWALDDLPTEEVFLKSLNDAEY